MPRPALVAVSTLLLAVSATACTGGGKDPAAQPTTTLSSRPSPSLSPCPAAAPTKHDWPADVPDDLPLPESVTITKNERSTGDILVLHFTVPWSLRESVVHIVNSFPKAGYQLARGDAEITEADAPFQRGELRGLVRVFLTGACRTTWLLAIGKSGGSLPINPSISPRPSGSPLPFG